ncbi:MAG: PAS domain-containing sensor histidine kinase [Acidimicrobiales bacterium]
MTDAMESQRSMAELFGIGRLFTLTHEAVVGADLGVGEIVLWNASAERVFGYSALEAIGAPLAMLVDPDLRDEHYAGIKRFRLTGEANLVGAGPVEVPAVRRDGERIFVALTLTEIPVGEPGQFVVGVIRDITAQKASEAELHRTHRAMQDFVATASHDLRTPLTSVLGYGRMLRDRADEFTPEQRAEFTQAVVRGAERASRLVDDLLTTSKIDAGALEVRPEEIDVRDAVGSAAASCGVAPDEISVADGLTITADADHFERILVNLLSNAAKYGRRPIEVRALVDGPTAEIRVCDHGDGVPAGLVDRLFEKFVRAGGSDDGAGLGLSIVRGLAETNGGEAFYEHLADGPVCFGIRTRSSRR